MPTSDSDSSDSECRSISRRLQTTRPTLTNATNSDKLKGIQNSSNTITKNFAQRRLDSIRKEQQTSIRNALKNTQNLTEIANVKKSTATQSNERKEDKTICSLTVNNKRSIVSNITSNSVVNCNVTITQRAAGSGQSLRDRLGPAVKRKQQENESEKCTNNSKRLKIEPPKPERKSSATETSSLVFNQPNVDDDNDRKPIENSNTFGKMFKKCFTRTKELTKNLLQTKTKKSNGNTLIPDQSTDQPIEGCSQTIQQQQNQSIQNSFHLIENDKARGNKSFANDRLARLRNTLNGTLETTLETSLEYMDDDNSMIVHQPSPDWRNIQSKSFINEILKNVPTSPDPLSPLALTPLNFELTSKRQLFIVIDTNILLDSLPFVEQLLNGNFEVLVDVKLFIPFVVLQELDKLKMRKDELKASVVTHIIRFLNAKFKEKHPALIGQSSIDDNNHLINIDSPDDRLLNCCLQLKRNDNNCNVVLFSNDINLRNKAMCSDIAALSKSDILHHLKVRKY